MVAPAPAPRRSVARVLPPHPVVAALVMLVFTALLYVVELVDQLTGESLDSEGIVSRSLSGLGGIIWAPLLHGGWPHLLANTVLFAIWGGVLLGVLPGAPEVSWQGHLFGALAGLLCAALVAKADRRPAAL